MHEDMIRDRGVGEREKGCFQSFYFEMFVTLIWDESVVFLKKGNFIGCQS